MADAGGSRILLVADADESIRSLVYLTLKNERTEVLEAADVDETLDLLHAHEPVLAIIDLGLPELGGVETCRRIRESGQGPRTILLVRKAELGNIPDEAISDGLLTKPFTSLALLRKVDQMLGGI
ncbi:MAG: response regulator [Actinomycetota bacterium]|nr:response regulator [Actinomycetota bacterium]